MSEYHIKMINVMLTEVIIEEMNIFYSSFEGSISVLSGNYPSDLGHLLPSDIHFQVRRGRPNDLILKSTDLFFLLHTVTE